MVRRVTTDGRESKVLQPRVTTENRKFTKFYVQKNLPVFWSCRSCPLSDTYSCRLPIVTRNKFPHKRIWRLTYEIDSQVTGGFNNWHKISTLSRCLHKARRVSLFKSMTEWEVSSLPSLLPCSLILAFFTLKIFFFAFFKKKNLCAFACPFKSGVPSVGSGLSQHGMWEDDHDDNVTHSIMS